VLTTELGFVPEVAEAYDRYDMEPHVLFFQGSDEATLRWLYENSVCLCLTSTLEGNFPPQIREALTYQTPIVATRLAPIVEALGGKADELLLCDPLDIDDFVQKIKLAMSQRLVVLERQSAIFRALEDSASEAAFFEILSTLLGPAAEQLQVVSKELV
jgi:hypothetical protein